MVYVDKACNEANIFLWNPAQFGFGSNRSEREEGGAVVEPYVAAIVAPYVRSSQPLQSLMAWFRVEHPSGHLPSGICLLACIIYFHTTLNLKQSAGGLALLLWHTTVSR